MCPAVSESNRTVATDHYSESEQLSSRDTAKEDLVRGCLELFKQGDPDASAGSLTAVAVVDPDLAVRLAVEGDLPLPILGRAFGAKDFAARQEEAHNTLCLPTSWMAREILYRTPDGTDFLGLVRSLSPRLPTPYHITELIQRYVATEIRGRTLREIPKEILPHSELSSIEDALSRKEKHRHWLYTVEGEHFRLPILLDQEMVAGILLRHIAKKSDLSPLLPKYLAQLEERFPNICEGRFKTGSALLEQLLDHRPLNPMLFPISKIDALRVFLDCRGNHLSETTLSYMLRNTDECCTFLVQLRECSPVAVLRELEEALAATTKKKAADLLAEALDNRATDLRTKMQEVVEIIAGSNLHETFKVPDNFITTIAVRDTHRDHRSVIVRWNSPDVKDIGWVHLPHFTTAVGCSPGEQLIYEESDYVLVGGAGGASVLRTPHREILLNDSLTIRHTSTKLLYGANINDRTVYLTAEFSRVSEHSLWDIDSSGTSKVRWRLFADESKVISRLTLTLQNGQSHSFRVKEGGVHGLRTSFGDTPIAIGMDHIIASQEQITKLGRQPNISLPEASAEGILYFRPNHEYYEQESPPRSTWIYDLVRGTRIDLPTIAYVSHIHRFGSGYILIGEIPEGEVYRSHVVRIGAEGAIMWQARGDKIVSINESESLVIYSNRRKSGRVVDDTFVWSKTSGYATIMARKREVTVTGPKVKGDVYQVPGPHNQVYLASNQNGRIHIFCFEKKFSLFRTASFPSQSNVELAAHRICGIDVISCLNTETARLSLLSPYSTHEVEGVVSCHKDCFIKAEIDAAGNYRILERLPISTALKPLFEKDITFLTESAEALVTEAPLEAARPPSSHLKLSSPAGGIQVSVLNTLLAESPEALAHTLPVRSSTSLLDSILFAYFPAEMRNYLLSKKRDRNEPSHQGFVNSDGILIAGGDPRYEGKSIGTVSPHINKFFLAQEFAAPSIESLRAVPTPPLGGFRSKRRATPNAPTCKVTLAEPSPGYTFPMVAPIYSRVISATGPIANIKNNLHGGYSATTNTWMKHLQGEYTPTEIDYTLSLEPEVAPYDVTQAVYSVYLTRLKQRGFKELITPIIDLPPSAERYLQSIKSLPPLTRAALISDWIRQKAHYDFDHAEVADRYAEAPLNRHPHLMAYRLVELRRGLRRRGESCEHLEGKEFAGVCAQAALLGVAMLREAGIASSYGTGYVVENGMIRSDKMHAIPIVYYPTKRGGTAKLEVECTPEGRDPVTGRTSVVAASSEFLKRVQEEAVAKTPPPDPPPAQNASAVQTDRLQRDPLEHNISIPIPSAELHKIVQVIEGLPLSPHLTLEECLHTFQSFYWPNSGSTTIDLEAAIASEYFSHQVKRVSKIFGMSTPFASELLTGAIKIASDMLIFPSGAQPPLHQSDT